MFYYDGTLCMKTVLRDGKYYIKQRKGRQYIDTEVVDTCIYMLTRLYRKHRSLEGFQSIFCRLRRITDQNFMRFALMMYFWDDIRKAWPPAADNSVHPSHGNARTSNHNATFTPFMRSLSSCSIDGDATITPLMQSSPPSITVIQIQPRSCHLRVYWN